MNCSRREPKPRYQWPIPTPNVMGMETTLTPSQIAACLVQRGAVAQSEGGTLVHYREAINHPLKNVRARDDLLDIIAVLTAQLVCVEARVSADETLALHQIETIITEHRAREQRAITMKADTPWA